MGLAAGPGLGSDTRNGPVRTQTLTRTHQPGPDEQAPSPVDTSVLPEQTDVRLQSMINGNLDPWHPAIKTTRRGATHCRESLYLSVSRMVDMSGTSCAFSM